MTPYRYTLYFDDNNEVIPGKTRDARTIWMQMRGFSSIKRYLDKKRRYLINCITPHTELISDTDEDKVRYLAEAFKRDYLCEYELKRNGTIQKTFEEYIKGLPSCLGDIDFYNHDIIDKEMSFGKVLKNENQEYQAINKWFESLSREAMKLFEKYNITF